MAWAVIVAALASCSENIDTEYQFTAKEETILEYLEQGKNAAVVINGGTAAVGTR